MAKKSFYLLKRRDRLTDGKPTFYCRLRGVHGELQPWRSTGEVSKTRAELWAQSEIEKRNAAIPDAGVTLQDFAKGFFDWETSAWIHRQHAKGRRFSEPVSRSRQGQLERYILPRFGKVCIVDLDQKSIEDWLSSLPLSGQTRNHILYSFRIVLREAKLAGIVRHNVLADAEPFGADPKRRDIFSLADLHKLFPDDPKMLASIWGDPERSVAFLLLASTGIRSGECRALRWLNVIGERALYVDSGLDAFNRPKGTKTETARAVLLPTKARTALALWRELAPFKADDDFIFSEGRGQPHGRNWLTRTLSPAMKRAGVETGQRHLVVHSFRHTFVSMMRASTSDEIAMAMSGHVTDKALDIYTHRNVQDLLARLEPSRDAIEKTLSW